MEITWYLLLRSLSIYGTDIQLKYLKKKRRIADNFKINHHTRNCSIWFIIDRFFPRHT